MITALEILQENGETFTLRNLAREFSIRNDGFTIMYDDLAGVLGQQEKNGLVKCVAVHNTDYRENKWAAT